MERRDHNLPLLPKLLNLEISSQVAQVGKVVPILKDQLAALEGKPDGLDDLLELHQARHRLMPTINQAIHNESTIVRCLAKVTAVSIVAIFILSQTMIGPFPDEPALETGIVPERLLVVLYFP